MKQIITNFLALLRGGMMAIWLFIGAILGVLVVLLSIRIFLFPCKYRSFRSSSSKDAIRVACIGDSLTYGAMVKMRFKNCYPAKLGKLLGKGYVVRNFGANGQTMLKSGDQPYWKHENFRKSSDFLPNIVIILLGSNDTKKHNWKTVEQFIADYREMVSYYRRLSSHPEIYVLTPPTAYILDGHDSIFYQMSNEVMDEMSRAIQKMAVEENLTVIDTRKATSGHPECFPKDGVHTDVRGAALIAQTVYQVVAGYQIK